MTHFQALWAMHGPSVSSAKPLPPIIPHTTFLGYLRAPLAQVPLVLWDLPTQPSFIYALTLGFLREIFPVTREETPFSCALPIRSYA